MGVTAIIWLIDSFVGFYLTLPLRRQGDSKPLGAALESNLESLLERRQQ